MMEGALANEEYEIAAELRDRIQMLKDKATK
jgi:protein-arginine kinase activator protein McsA